MAAGDRAAGRHAQVGGGTGPGAVTENAAELSALVVAARNGDRPAAEALIAAYLPLLYRIVGRALDGHADVDDVVQETVLRAHRDLPTLRTPASFRSWLVAIAMHQVSTRLRAWQQERERSAPLDDAARLADPAADFADVTLLRLGLSAQRRQVAEATRWLDPDDQELAALWWREVAGEITRAELVRTLGLSPAHARVRLQRMRQQLELSRCLVAALQAEPRCPGLDEVAEGWDGTPSPRWRKRFARHVRDCPVCGAAPTGFFPLERLVVGAAAIPLPAAAAIPLSAAAGASGVLGAVATAGATGAGTVFGAKVVTAVLIGAAVSGGVYLARPDDAPPPSRPAPTAAPSASASGGAGRPASPRPPSSTASATPRPSAPAGPGAARLVPPGRVVLRPAGSPGAVVALDGNFLVTATGVPGVVLNAIPGVTDAQCVSLRAGDGRWFRHASFRIMLSPEEDRELFRMDSTFCPRPGPGPGTVRLASFNYPDRLVRVVDGQLRLDPQQTDAAFLRSATFTLHEE
ncbi:sigma-70 family RNA polymerase sigma factor [Actinoplanes sp. M2I2]|uniref:sigma-70 family RNA polymerase sigma factor n=1 Tax=Actinoplanes sp. M2I2 TaxID=1734444 RepID=UPI00202231D9|nr:sigma-70 family RNA polymerase sigma factor [Actinoplanes sp. M2I2]